MILIKTFGQWDIINAVYYDTIEGKRSKSNNSKEYMICHYSFFNHGFKF